jgi:hypothetical protein
LFFNGLKQKRLANETNFFQKRSKSKRKKIKGQDTKRNEKKNVFQTLQNSIPLVSTSAVYLIGNTHTFLTFLLTHWIFSQISEYINNDLVFQKELKIIVTQRKNVSPNLVLS